MKRISQKSGFENGPWKQEDSAYNLLPVANGL